MRNILDVLATLAALATVSTCVVAIVRAEKRWGALKRGAIKAGGWLRPIFAYVRRGFKLAAVLDFDHKSGRAMASVHIGTPEPSAEGVVRVCRMTSYRFETVSHFAHRVWAACPYQCVMHGFNPLDIVAPGVPAQTVFLDTKDGQPCILLLPGWCPIEPVAEDRLPVQQFPKQMLSN